MSDIVHQVMGALQAGYEDATQTPLDREVAQSVVQVFKDAGWMPLNEVATLIKAAGGKITVGQDDYVFPGDPVTVWVQDDYATFGKIVSIKEEAPSAPAHRCRLS